MINVCWTGEVGRSFQSRLTETFHNLGTLTNDTADAVAGRVGTLPHTVPVTVLARDTDTKKQEQLHV